MAQNLTTGVQFLENGSGFLALNKKVLALVNGMTYSQKQASDSILTYESSFFEGKIPTTQSATLSGDFICTSGFSFNYYSGATGTTKIAAGTITGTTNGLALFQTQLNRTEINVAVKLATGFVLRGNAIIDSLDVKYKSASELTGSISLTFSTKPVISST